MMQPKSPLTIKQRVGNILLRDPKKTGLMAGLALVMIVLWARMFFNGPATATASFLRRSVAAFTNSPDSPTVQPSSNPVMDWLAQPKRPLERNLFAIHLDYYARAGDRKASTDPAEDPEKSDTEAADQNRERQILLENLQTQAAKLKLQTTVMGQVPAALVNGELVRQGDTIGGFRVVKIEPRKIAIEQDGVTLEIGMP